MTSTKTVENEQAISKETQTKSMRMLRICMEQRIPAMLVSNPGMTKTASVRELARDMGYDLVILIGSRSEAPDVTGYPMVASEEINGVVSKVTDYAVQKWQQHIVQHPRTVLFLDEWSNTPPSVRASFLSIIQDRQFPNGDMFPDETIIVGAMNPVESSPDGYELDPASSNRMAHIEWVPSVASWLEGMMKNFNRPTPVSDNEKDWRELIVRFLKDNTGLVNAMPSLDDARANPLTFGGSNTPSGRTVFQNSWPSMRSWDNAAHALAGVSTDDTFADSVVASLVGFEAATKFREWLIANGSIDAKNIFEKSLSSKPFSKWKSLKLDEVNSILGYACDRMMFAETKEDYVESVKRTCALFDSIFDHDVAASAAPSIPKFAHSIHNGNVDVNRATKNKLVNMIGTSISRYHEYTMHHEKSSKASAK